MMKRENEMRRKRGELLIGKNVSTNYVKGFVLAFAVLFLVLSLLNIISAASYSRTSTAYTPLASPLGGVPSSLFTFNQEMCQTGQDFVLQISPYGCQPSVVRSDLLEENNAPVFCPIIGMQVNPLIGVKAINRISFSYNGNAPKEVQGLSYTPARAALETSLLGSNVKMNEPILNNMGYAVIVLRRQPNESAMPDFVQGNLTATLMYDIKNAFGVGASSYYLPEMSDSDWNERQEQYGFWRGKGFLRAEGIGDDSATISIYSDRNSYGTGRTVEKIKISSSNLKIGQSMQVPLPGFNYCLGNLKVTLLGLENPGTRARLVVNGDVIEIKEGERFLENKCIVKKIDKRGLFEKVDISCKQDSKSPTISLTVSPKLNLLVSGQNEKEFGIGDLLYTFKDKDDKDRGVYIGFIGNEENVKTLESTYTMLVDLPLAGRTTQNSLTENEISTIATATKENGGVIDKIMSTIKKGANNVLKGWNFNMVLYGKGKETVGGKEVGIMDFSSAVDSEFPTTPEGVKARVNYESSKKDYETILNQFASETYPPEDMQMLGEKALTNIIELAWTTNQKKTATTFCKEFSESYPNSDIPPICKNALELSSMEVSVGEVTIGSKTYLIEFDGAEEPSLDDYSTDISVTNVAPGYENYPNQITQYQKVYLSATDFIILTKLEDEYAEFDVSGVQKERTASNSVKINLNSYAIVGTNKYQISVNKITLKKLASVSISPNVNYETSKANISFKIGIEKRGIQLSPEKTKSRIESLNKTIEKWEGINSKLGTLVQTEKKVCAATGAFLTAKNFLANLGGQGIARQTVMRGPNGWFEKCKDAVEKGAQINNKGPWKSVDSCLTGNSDEIDASVNVYAQAMDQQTKNDKEITTESVISTDVTGEQTVDSKKYVEQKLTTSKEKIKTDVAGIPNIKVSGKDVSASEIVASLNSESISATQLRDLELNAGLLNQPGIVGEIAKAQVTSILTGVYANKEKISAITALSQKMQAQVDNPLSEIIKDQVSKEGVYYGSTAKEGNTLGISAGTPVKLINLNNVDYLLELELAGQNVYTIKNVYDSSSGNLLVADNPLSKKIKEMFSSFVLNKYQNSYPDGSARVTYFESGPYKGLPAAVPFDLKNGWYAAIKSILPVGGAIKPYDDSVRVSSFYICNIGEDRKQSTSDDDCQYFVPRATGQTQAFGLSVGESSDLFSRAESAIVEASQARARTPGITKVTIARNKIQVGSPAVNIPSIQCQDFMSPSDCNLLFNVCDPVICPSSRCDLGGDYPVADVIQSGVIGGLMLCLPNYPDVKVPICLSAVNAGLSGYLSVANSYQQCLQTSLETGQQVGICDEINSVYMCDFFWRQSLPLVKIAAPKIIGSVLGQNTRGGGEYLGVQDAMQKAGDSIDFFTQYYASNSFNAFKLRTVEGVGTEVCHNWISIASPKGGNLLDALTTPDVPPQFYGRFDEIPLTTATNPPMSQYKVFYHIYAGKDFPAYYQVYLKGAEGSFFEDTGQRRIVANGFIKRGEFKTDTPDFPAPAGYKELCIVVNNQEECGFKQVTTEFGINYLTEQAVASQASQTNIKTEAACISGTPSALNLLTPNIQSAAEGLANPAIYNQGITRVCATTNPGTGTDSGVGTANQRWTEVGICGNEKMKCWLDGQSVKDTIRSVSTEKGVNDAVKNVNQALSSTELTPDEFTNLVDSVDKEKDLSKKVGLIAAAYNRVSENDKKGYLTLLRANAYKAIAVSAYRATRPTKATDTSTTAKPATPEAPSNLPVNEATARKTLIGAGISVKDGTVVLQGVREQTLIEIENLKQSCAGCEITITSGTEGNHAEGQYSHSNGYKVDLRLNTKLDTYIKQNFEDVGKRSGDNAQQYRNKVSGAVYALEVDHWDVLVVPAQTPQAQEMQNIGKITYPIFEFKDDTIAFNLYYTFSGSNWHWSVNPKSTLLTKERWISTAVSSSDADGGLRTTVRAFIASSTLTDQQMFAQLTDKNKEFVKSLDGQSYTAGLSKLMNRVYIRDGGDFSSNPSLVTDSVEYSSEEIFTLTKDDKIFFKYSIPKKNWQISSDLNVWTDVNAITTIGNSQIALTSFNKNIATILRDKNSIQGAERLFGLDSASGTSSTSGTSGTSGTATTSAVATTGATVFTCTTFEDCQKEVTTETNGKMKCLDLPACQRNLSSIILGREILKLAEAKKTSDAKFSDAVVKQQTGAKNFECLALQVAYRESDIHQCSPTQENGNPLYCEGDYTKTVHGDNFGSVGTMEINIAFKNNAGQLIGHCGTYGLSSNLEECKKQLSDFETNINVGLNVLINGYNSNSKTFTCTNKQYSGWTYALRNYNGWGCTGNNEYVSHVLGFNDEIKALFPECA